MISQDDFVQKMEKLINLLERWNYEYNILNNPSVDDEIYDQTLKELKYLEEKHNFFLPNSPTQKIGAASEKKKFRPVKHQTPMLSLDSTDDYKYLERFNQRVKRKSKLEDLEYLCELKIDGLSASLIYQQGKLTQIATRGDGWTGEDVSLNKNLIQDIPLILPKVANCEIRGEIYMKKSEFFQLNEDLKKRNLGLLANPRNAAAGTLRTLVPIQQRNLHFFAYQVFSDARINKQENCLQKLIQLGFQVSPIYQICKNLEAVRLFFQQAKELRENLEFEIDGIVIKVNDYHHYNLLGQTSKFPRWALAYKFPASLVVSEIKNIITEITRSGRVSYVAQINPVLLKGSKISKVTLHNYRFIQESKIDIGDRVVVKKAGDVIPQIIQIIKLNDQTSCWIPPSYCHSCFSELIWNEEKIYQLCLNNNCPERIIKSLAFFASKSGMDIKGISEAIIRKLFQAKLLNSPVDFYCLQEEQKEIHRIEGFQKKSISNLLRNIEESKKRPFSYLLAALGIPLLGPIKCRKLATIYPNLITFLGDIEKDQLNLNKGLGTETEKAIKEFFQDDQNIQLLKQLAKINFDF